MNNMMSRAPKFKRKLITLATILLVGAIVLYDSSIGDESSSPLDYYDPADVEYRALTVIEDSVQQQEALPGWWRSEESNENSTKLYMYLEGTNDNAGLGHSFMGFNKLVALARKHRLMPRFVFQTSGHDLTPVNVRRYFFGAEFMARLHPGMKCNKVKTTPESLPELITAAKSRGEQGCKVFSLRKPMGPAQSWKSLGFNLPLLRKQFQLNGHQDTVVRKDLQQVSGDVTIAVHIRRGDLFDFLKKHHPEQVTGRLVTESAYVSVLKQLFSKLEAHGKTNINVVLYCEGMKGSSTIMTVQGTYSDISKEFSFEGSNLNVRWSRGATYTLQAFDDMCHSDIIITGTSGFSYVVSVLCSKPIILALPFWLPYRDIPNAIDLEVERGNYTLPHMNIHKPVSLRNHARFNESEFDSLFSTMMSSEIEQA